MWKSAKNGPKRDPPSVRGQALGVLAMALIVVAACAETGPIAEPTESAQPGGDIRPSATEVRATELPAPKGLPPEAAGLATATPTTTAPSPSPDPGSSITTATLEPPPLASVPTVTPIDTPVPTVPPAVLSATPITLPTSTAAAIPMPPPYHYSTRAEAVAGAVELGCTGWNQVTVDGTVYYRACASAELFGTLVAAATNPAPDAQGAVTASPTAASVQSTPTPIPAAQPTSTAVPPTQAPAPTPPPYHFATQAEAEAGAVELGCSGFGGVRVEDTFYYRACGSVESYDLLVSGAPITLSGAPCTLKSDATVRFSVSPTDLAQIGSIVPAGSP